MGLVVYAKELGPPFGDLMRNLNKRPRHLGALGSADDVYFLRAPHAAVGTHRGFTFVFNEIYASVLANEVERYGRPTKTSIEKQARTCDILVASMHSTTSSYGHAVFHKGRFVAGESSYAPPLALDAARFPPWYHGPTGRFTEGYVLDLANAFVGFDISSWLSDGAELEQYEV